MNILKYLLLGTITIIKFPFCFIKYFIIGLITIISIIPYYVITGIKFITKKNNHQEKNIIQIEKKFISITILILSITTYLLSVFILTRWYVQNERTKNFTNDFKENPFIELETIPPVTQETPSENNQIEAPNENTQTENEQTQYQDPTPIKPAPENSNTNKNKINTNFINVNLNYYIQKNPETVGWLQVNGTKVNYPLVQHSDNNYYLEHDFYKRKSSGGWIFGDYRNNFNSFDNNTIIYGHNMINNTMFGTIPYLLKNNWFNNKNNHYIKLSTKNTNTIWQIFSVYKIDPVTDYLQTKFSSTIEYEKLLNKLKERSSYNFNLELNYTDKIITLSTCSNSGTKRIAIHAKLIKIENK